MTHLQQLTVDIWPDCQPADHGLVCDALMTTSGRLCNDMTGHPDGGVCSHCCIYQAGNFTVSTARVQHAQQNKRHDSLSPPLPPSACCPAPPTNPGTPPPALGFVRPPPPPPHSRCVQSSLKFTCRLPPCECSSPSSAAMRELLPEPTTPTTITSCPLIAFKEML